MRHGGCLLGLAIVIGGCMAPSGSASESGLALPLDPAARVEYTCGVHSFTKDLLSQPANAEQANDAWTAALRTFLATPAMDIDWLPDRGWLLAGVDAKTATFIAVVGGDPQFPVVSVGVSNEISGWRVGGWGQCRPSAVLRGLGSAMWRLDPDAPPLRPGDRRFVALVTEMACAGGRSSEGRVAPPVILYGRDEILVIFGVRPLGGEQTCPGNPFTRIVVRLDQPIGGRQLMDGGFLPPRDPTQDPFSEGRP